MRWTLRSPGIPAYDLAASYSSYHDKGFRAGGDCVGQGGVRWLMGQIFFAGEEAEEGPALERAVLADGAAQHGIAGFERV